MIASEGGPRYAGVFRIGLSIAASIARHSEFAPSALSSWTWCSSTSATPRAPHIAGRAAMLMTKLVRCSRHPYVLRTQTHVAASASEAGHIRRPVRRSGAACVSRESSKAMGTRRGGVHMPANQVTGSACTDCAQMAASPEGGSPHAESSSNLQPHPAAMSHRISRTLLGAQQWLRSNSGWS